MSLLVKIHQGVFDMPLDDLDRLLALELGGHPEQKKISEQVSSLEALVLNRVKQDHPLAEKSDKDRKIEVVADAPPALEPLFQFLDALMPIVTTVQQFLADETVKIEQSELLKLRTELAEALLALPEQKSPETKSSEANSELKNIDKAGIFAAMVTCINAAGSLDTDARQSARERLQRLVTGITTAQSAADRKRNEAFSELLD